MYEFLIGYIGFGLGFCVGVFFTMSARKAGRDDVYKEFEEAYKRDRKKRLRS